MTSNITMNSAILDVLEAHQWILSSFDDHNGKYCAELETWSPAGEDVVVTIWYDGTPDDFAEQFRLYAEDFDAADHAVMWYGANRGEPSSLRDLLDDADAIDALLTETARDLLAVDFSENYDKFDEDFIRNNWQRVLKCSMPYNEIAHTIRWGFSRADLEELMRLHKENICRNKIEDLLEDCNFHTECGNWHDGNYVLRED